MRLKIAVIGAGHLGRLHALKLLQIEQAELVGLCETSAERRQVLSAELKQPIVATWAELGHIDAAVIATPTSEHFTVAELLIRRGVHVFIEKPVVRTASEAADLEKLSRDFPKVVVQVGHIERFNPAIVAVNKLNERPWYIVGERLGPFKERSIDVDVIDDLMIHDLDLVLGWMASPVREVRAIGVSIMTNHIDMADARIEFESGAVANLSASRSSLDSSRKLRLFTGSRYLSVDLEKKLVKSVHRLPAPPGEKWPEIEGGMLDVLPEDALLAEDRSFVDACLSGGPPVVTLAAGVAALALAERIKHELRTPMHVIS